MLTQHVLLGRKIAPLSEEERHRLETAIAEVRIVPHHQVLIHKGEEVDVSTLLVSGFLSRVVVDRRGNRQFVSLHVPGDLVDMHAYPMKQLDHDIVSLSDCEIALMPHSAIKAIIDADAELGRKLWFATLLDAAMHREWIFRLGRLDGPGRVCHFFAETGARLEAIGLGDAGRFHLPMTQVELSEACGLTSIHMNRVLRILRDGNVCTFKDGEVLIQDPAVLAKLGQFDPAYLYLQHPPETSQ